LKFQANSEKTAKKIQRATFLPHPVHKQAAHGAVTLC